MLTDLTPETTKVVVRISPKLNEDLGKAQVFGLPEADFVTWSIDMFLTDKSSHYLDPNDFGLDGFGLEMFVVEAVSSMVSDLEKEGIPSYETALDWADTSGGAYRTAYLGLAKHLHKTYTPDPDTRIMVIRFEQDGREERIHLSRGRWNRICKSAQLKGHKSIEDWVLAAIDWGITLSPGAGSFSGTFIETEAASDVVRVDTPRIDEIM